MSSASSSPPAQPPFWLNLVSGALAGVVGTSCIFPLDMVKTRLQNQVVVDGKRQYSSAVQCALHIIRNEGGIGALYRGLTANLIGVTPEKAIKLACNDYFRSKLADPKTGKLTPLNGALAGGLAGFCQCIATNPMEITKIRMQMAAESGRPASMGSVLSELGLRGLYRGSPSTLLRDIPFSMLFFSTYGYLRDLWAVDGSLSLQAALAAGLTAGVVGASASTPADVIKTRIQSKPRPGQQSYNRIGEAISGILQKEGPGAFFKGVVPRCLIISPLFGVALVTYELCKKVAGY